MSARFATRRCRKRHRRSLSRSHEYARSRRATPHPRGQTPSPLRVAQARRGPTLGALQPMPCRAARGLLSRSSSRSSQGEPLEPRGVRVTTSAGGDCAPAEHRLACSHRLRSESSCGAIRHARLTREWAERLGRGDRPGPRLRGARAAREHQPHVSIARPHVVRATSSRRAPCSDAMSATGDRRLRLWDVSSAPALSRALR